MTCHPLIVKRRPSTSSAKSRNGEYPPPRTNSLPSGHATFTDEEKARLGRIQQFLSDEGSAYFKVHANRPQTIATA